MYDVMLSICVPVYNHEKYIVRALDSILMQKTQYSYEVWVGEDCSTDNTRFVLKEYEKKHPGKFNILYRDKNMHSETIINSMDLRLRSNGKYLIILEGDDYWKDEYKIEKQISFLESNPQYIAVAHNCIVVDENSNEIDMAYPECKDNEYTLEHFCNDILPGQTATFMVRNYFKQKYFDTCLVKTRLYIGDRPLFFSAASYGRIYCMQEKMSAYRFITNSGSSHAATYKPDYDKEKIYHLALIEYANKINNKSAIYCAEIVYALMIYKFIKKNKLSLRIAFRDLLRIKHKGVIAKAAFQKLVFKHIDLKR